MGGMERDFAAHNEAVRRLWDAYRAGRPERVPVTFSVSPRVFLLDKARNPKRWTPRQAFVNPDVMWELSLAFQRWLRFDLVQDAEMGPPGAWEIGLPLWNTYEAGWFGCEVVFPAGDIPDTRPMYRDSKKRLHDTALPDPLMGNLMGRALEAYWALTARAKREDFLGRPVRVTGLPVGTDGPFTVACNLRGATELCEDLAEDEAFFHALMAHVTDGIILRIMAWKKLAAMPETGLPWFGDDAIQLLSVAAYRNAVLPYHRRLLDAFGLASVPQMHLCGRAQHLFPTLVAELGVGSFEVGFPTDLKRAREELGEHVELIGNIHPGLLRDGPPEAIREAVRGACASGVRRGGKFILRDGNDCAPGTPDAHYAAMYEAGRTYGA